MGAETIANYFHTQRLFANTIPQSQKRINQMLNTKAGRLSLRHIKATLRPFNKRDLRHHSQKSGPGLMTAIVIIATGYYSN